MVLGSVAKKGYRGSLPKRQPSGVVREGVVAVGDQIELVSRWVVVAVNAERCYLHHVRDQPLPIDASAADVGVRAGA
jgi:hypothetical protein